MQTDTKEKVIAILLIAVGLGSLGNAAWMLFGPNSWYSDLPAKIPDLGDFNIHFVRDLGCAFVGIGVSLIWAGRNAALRFPLAVTGTIFYALHALVHIYDTARGYVDHSHWYVDLPLTYLPALLLVPISIHLYRQTK